MNIEKLIAITAGLGITYPYSSQLNKAPRVFVGKSRKPTKCKTDPAYIAAEAKRQKRIQRNKMLHK